MGVRAYHVCVGQRRPSSRAQVRDGVFQPTVALQEFAAIELGDEEIGVVADESGNVAAGADPAELEKALADAIDGMKATYPGIAMTKKGDMFHIVIPDALRISHEAHFAQVTTAYLGYLVDGKLPHWEVPNMIAKYYTTTQALEMARAGK